MGMRLGYITQKRLLSEKMIDGVFCVLCSVCKQWKEATHNFCKDKRGTGRYFKTCNTCKNKKMRKAGKTDRVRLRNREYRNRPEVIERRNKMMDLDRVRKNKKESMQKRALDNILQRMALRRAYKAIELGVVKKRTVCDVCGAANPRVHLPDGLMNPNNIEFLCRSHLRIVQEVMKRTELRRLKRLDKEDPELKDIIAANKKKNVEELQWWEKKLSVSHKYKNEKEKAIFDRKTNLEYLFWDYAPNERAAKIKSIIEDEIKRGML